MTVDKLLEKFVCAKYTGLEKPGNWHFILHIIRIEIKMLMTLKT